MSAWTTVLIAITASGLGQTLLVIAAAAVRRGGNIYFTAGAVTALTTPLAWFAGGIDLAVIHLSLGGMLQHFLTLPDRSVTLRVLVELLLAPDEQLSVTELTARYGVQAMIESRVQQLATGGFLQIGPDGEIVLLKRGLAFGRFVSAGRRLFGIESAN